MNSKERKEQDRIDSMRNHKILGFPIIKKILNLKEIHSVEEHLGNDDLKTILDMFEGSDSIGLLKNNLGVIGIASRVQWAHHIFEEDPYHPPSDYWYPPKLNKFLKDKGYQTFTVRYERKSGTPTEYIKRLNAILHKTSYPIYTVHQYVSDRYAYKGSGKILSLGICKTKELIMFIENGKEGIDYELKEVPDFGEALFFVIAWPHYINFHEILFYPKDFIRKNPQTNLFKFKIKGKTNQEV